MNVTTRISSELTVFTYKGKDHVTLGVIDGIHRSKNEIVVVIGRSTEHEVMVGGPGNMIAIPKTYLPILRKVLSDIEKGD